jgi:hypothetical protein
MNTTAYSPVHRLIIVLAAIASIAHLADIYMTLGFESACENAIIGAVVFGPLLFKPTTGSQIPRSADYEAHALCTSPVSSTVFEPETVVAYYVHDSSGYRPVMIEID